MSGRMLQKNVQNLLYVISFKTKIQNPPGIMRYPIPAAAITTTKRPQYQNLSFFILLNREDCLFLQQLVFDFRALAL